MSQQDDPNAENLARQLAELDPDEVLNVINRTLDLQTIAQRPGKAEARRRFGNQAGRRQ